MAVFTLAVGYGILHGQAPQPDVPVAAAPATENPVAKKLRAIVIPNFTIRDTKLTTVIKHLNNGATRFDQTSVEPKGVRITPGFDPAVEDPLITVAFKNGTLEKLLQTVTEPIGYTYRIDGNSVVISKQTAQPEQPQDADPKPEGPAPAEDSPLPLLWQQPIGGIVSVIGKDGTIYIRQQKKLTALDGQTGQTIWEYDAGDIVKTPAIDDSGAILFQVGQTSIHAVNPIDGNSKWKAPFNVKGGTAPSITPDGKFAIGANGPGSVFTFDCATGKRAWEYRTFNWVGSTPASGQDGLIFIATTTNNDNATGNNASFGVSA